MWCKTRYYIEWLYLVPRKWQKHRVIGTNNVDKIWLEAWSSGYERWLMLERLCVWIPVLYTGWTWHFLHWFVVKIVLFVWKDSKYTKRGWGWHIFGQCRYRWAIDCGCLLSSKLSIMDGHHSSVDQSAPTILWPNLRIQSFFQLIFEYCVKRTKIKQKEVRIDNFFKKLSVIHRVLRHNVGQCECFMPIKLMFISVETHW